MTIQELLSRLRDVGARVTVADGRLRVDAPRGVLSQELQEGIRRHKTKLLTLLGDAAQATSGIPRRNADAPPAPQSHAQERLWLYQTLDPDATAYNLTPVARLRGRLDIAQLEAAATRLSERHEPLRTIFSQENGRVVQRVQPAMPVRISCEDISALSAEEQDGVLREAVRREQGRPFDIARTSPFRLTLFRRSETAHDLLAAFHHIAVDGTSIEIFFRDLIELYGGSPLSELPIRFTDFADWERQNWSEARLHAEVGYWVEHLSSAPWVLELPTDRPRPASIRFSGGVATWLLDEDLSARLRALLRDEQASLFMALLAALAAALHAESGQRDLVIGTATSGRSRAELRDLVGMFVNQIALRVQVGRGVSFRELLRSARATALDGFAHQDVPFAKVIDALSPPRDASRTPIFQIQLNVLPPTAQEIAAAGGISCSSPDAGDMASLFDRQSSHDMILYGRQIGPQIQLELLYNAELYDAQRAESLLDAVKVVIVGAIADADAPLESVLSGTVEPGGVSGADPDDPETSAADRFEAIARRNPQRTAVIGSTREITYGDLLADVERIARLIVSVAGEPGAAGILVPHDETVPAAILGVLRAGRPYVPLDASYPGERLRFMLEDSGVRLIVTTPALVERARELAGAHVCVVELDGVPPAGTVLPPVPGPDATAYFLYTSGSTGQPKGVVQTQGNLVRQAARYARALHVDERDRLALTASISFDACLMDLFGALLSGAAVAPIDLRSFDLTQLPERLSERAVSVMHVTPTVLRTLKVDNGSFATIRAVVLGGERVRPEDVAFFDEHFSSDTQLLNLYGASEHSFSLGHFVDRKRRSGEVPIGRPVGDVRVELVDSNGQADPVRGELVIHSDFTARGYRERPDITERVFAVDPQCPARLLYRTGDIVRRRRDGSFVFLRRADDQVKIRGHRVESAEVESVLRTHPDVAEVAVHAPADGDGNHVLTACVVFSPDARHSFVDLGEWCRDRLPVYMVPTAWAELVRLPRTPSGKVDRRALPAGGAAMDGSRGSAGSSTGDSRPHYAAPRNAQEEVIASIWGEVLDTETVGVFDDFFDLGGHSLTATQVASRIREVLGVELSLRQFFDHPTVAATAELIRSGQSARVSLPPIVPLETDGPAPLSFAQERMWFLHEMSTGSSAYNMAYAVLLEGSLDIDRLRSAVEAVALRQECLRTRIVTEHGRAMQIVDPEPTHVFELTDLRHLPSAQRLERARQLAAQALEAPYDLARGPLFRLHVYRLADDMHVMATGMHHIVSDMWSLAIVMQGIARAYNGDGIESLPALAASYRDFSVWQREWLTRSTLEEQLAYWRKQLEGVPALDLPTDYARPRFYSFEGDYASRELSPGLRDAAGRLAAESQATPFMAYLAVVNALLYAHSRQEDFAVGVPIANRTQTATEHLVGTFVNTLTHRNDLSGDPTFGELLARVRSTALDAYAHQEIPFELLVKELQPERDPSRSALFQVLLNVPNVRSGGMDIPGVERTWVPLVRRAAQFDLTFSIGVDVRLTYNTSLFSRATAERLLDHYIEILERAVCNPDTRLSALAGPSSADRALVVESWNDTERDYPTTANVPALFAVAAVRTPGRTAVESPTGTFTCRELLDYAQRITAALRASGVQPGERVAIVMERSREMLGALLGILGSGAAYIPVDPSYPEARVRYVLEDSDARLVVTHRGLDRRFDLDTQILDLDAWTPPDPVPFAEMRPEQAAYVIYTSGSTGKPKGVEVSHGAMTNFLLSMQERPGMTADDALLAVTTISFDIAVLELYLPLIAGARVVIADEDEALDGRRLMQRMDDANVTLMQATPATWKLLISAGWTGKADLRVLCGGEPLSRSLADDLLDRVAEVWNMYGPTETTVWSTLDRIERDGPILIGRPIANTALYVLDDALEPRPIGVPGELYIGGAGVANGYVGRPDLTAERFIHNPFRPGERMYRTGDLVRHHHDGRLEHLGRLDNQVKIRGFRIELGEVEAALRSHVAVRDTVAVAADDRLVGYVVLEPGTHATTTELRNWVSTTLPPYMVPSFVVPLDALPLTPNGKVDRRQLPDPAGHAPEPVAWSAPTDPVGAIIAEIWGALLGIERVGNDDNFFEIGGHSLLAMEAVARIEERTGHRPEPRSLFFMTLGELAASMPSSVATA